MNRLLILHYLMMVTVLSAVSQGIAPLSRAISLDEALASVKQFYPENEANYFEIEDTPEAIEWFIFVDPSPLKGWEHECFTYTVPKKISRFSTLTKDKIIRAKNLMPPFENLIPLETVKYYDDAMPARPKIVKYNESGNGTFINSPVTYAIILSGGANKNANRIRYWNDCSYLYQVLTGRYGIPKANIYPLMADGANPEADINLGNEQYTSQSLDLDEDGDDEIIREASKDNIRNTLQSILQKIQKNEHLFIFVIDHGGQNVNEEGEHAGSYICLWNPNNQSSAEQAYRLQDYELAEMLKPFSDKKVNVNVVLGQCNSGGFIDDLTQVGCVVATASEATESSFGMPKVEYDEFVHHWTNAIHGYDVNGTLLSINPDIDRNGFVSMEEAFIYASNADTRRETPQYYSTPVSVGEDLAFDHLPDLINLHIRDEEDDSGKEPNKNTIIFWDSPDIWIRNLDDNIRDNEAISFNGTFTKATVYVDIHNRGIHDYASGQWLHLYWSKNTPTATTATLTGEEIYNNQATGGLLKSVVLPSLAADAHITIPVTCTLPGSLTLSTPQKYDMNITAVISESENGADLIGYDGINSYVLYNRNVAQKNVSLMGNSELSKTINFLIKNPNLPSRSFSLKIDGRDVIDKDILKYATIILGFSKSLSQSIESEEVGLIGASKIPNKTNEYKISSLPVILNGLNINSDEIENIRLNITYGYTLPQTSQNYILDIISQIGSDEVGGGTSISIQTPSLTSTHPTVAVNVHEGGKYTLKIIPDNNHSSSAWYDASGDIIALEPQITVVPTSNFATYTAATVDVDGYASTEVVSLESQLGIKQVFPTSNVESFLTVELTDNYSRVNSMLEISPILTLSPSLSVPVTDGEKSIKIDVSSLLSGWHILRLTCEDNVINEVKFLKK